VTRRNYWKSQRKREEELTRGEHKLAVMLLQDVDSVTVKSVSKALEDIDMGANQLQESSKAEVQRRGAAHHEYSNSLPPEVIAVLEDCDAKECEMEEAHVATHVKFADAVRKFFSKLQQEEKKFKEKMDQIQGNLSRIKTV
jgi:7-keto-8-aminopelargonate synthetase-like enzyme